MSGLLLSIITVEPYEEDGILYHTGQIILGDFVQQFEMPIDSWAVAEYMRQWDEGFHRLKYDQESCFVTCASGLEEQFPLIKMWCAYKREGTIFFQKHLLLEDPDDTTLPSLTTFSRERCYQFILPRVTDASGKAVFSEDEAIEVSEWSIPTDMVLSQESVFRSDA